MKAKITASVRSVLQTFKHISKIMQRVFWQIFEDDLAVMSNRARIILSDPDDVKLYKDAICKIYLGAEEYSITLKNGEKITLI